MRSPATLVGADRAYIDWVLRILEATASLLKTATVCLPRYLEGVYPHRSRVHPAISFRFPTDHEFHDLLRATDVLITVPGQEVVFESIYAGIPLIFLPPSNATQAFQSRTYQKNQIPIATLWPSYLDHVLTTNSDLNRLTGEIQRLHLRHLADKPVAVALETSLREGLTHLAADWAGSQTNVMRNRKLLSDLGAHGRDAAVQIIFDTIGSTALITGNAI